MRAGPWLDRLCRLLAFLSVLVAALSLWQFREDPARSTWLGLKPLRVEGTEMAPAVTPGDLVLVGPVGFDRLRDGDLLAYVEDDQILLRRMIERTASGLVVKADGYRVADGYDVTPSKLLGRVWLVVPIRAILAVAGLGLIFGLLVAGAYRKKRTAHEPS